MVTDWQCAATCMLRTWLRRLTACCTGVSRGRSTTSALSGSAPCWTLPRTLHARLTCLRARWCMSRTVPSTTAATTLAAASWLSLAGRSAPPGRAACARPSTGTWAPSVTTTGRVTWSWHCARTPYCWAATWHQQHRSPCPSRRLGGAPLGGQSSVWVCVCVCVCVCCGADLGRRLASLWAFCAECHRHWLHVVRLLGEEGCWLASSGVCVAAAAGGAWGWAALMIAAACASGGVLKPQLPASLRAAAGVCPSVRPQLCGTRCSRVGAELNKHGPSLGPDLAAGGWWFGRSAQPDDIGVGALSRRLSFCSLLGWFVRISVFALVLVAFLCCWVSCRSLVAREVHCCIQLPRNQGWGPCGPGSRCAQHWQQQYAA